MKLDSKYFDRIRVKPDEDRLLRDREPRCEWPGCAFAGTHPAPKGRGHEGEYHQFCLEHVREYNRSYNYFAGMADNEFVNYQRAAQHGHRPTWRLGANSWAYVNGGAKHSPGAGFRHGRGFFDPFGMFGKGEAEAPAQPRRTVRNAERKALEALGLDETAGPEEVKAQFKRLVKRHHPDTNGGRREGEDKLRAVIKAYDYLKSAGFC